MTITDWDDAYANGAYIDGAADYPDRWAALARGFRDGHRQKQLDITYGASDRQRVDLFLPAAAPLGLVVFVHGGYWMAFDKSGWSHLAAGPLACGYAVAIPSYDLAPNVRLSEIPRQIAAAITLAAQRVSGPILLTGHSAGGHLVARMGCRNAPLAPAIATRITRITPISGLPDLRPLLNTAMNATLGLDPSEAAAESPALLPPRQGFALTAWVGADERPEFRRQNALLPAIWGQTGLTTHTKESPRRHHFNVIDPLAVAGSDLCRAVLGT